VDVELALVEQCGVIECEVVGVRSVHFRDTITAKRDSCSPPLKRRAIHPCIIARIAA
jgi:hypothetical protein